MGKKTVEVGRGVRFQGREIDAIRLWDKYVDLPPNVSEDEQYLPLVKCPNPEHQTNKRHFQINQRDGLVHCFAQCGISGTFSRAISIIEGCSEREARKLILGHKITGRRKTTKRNVRSNFNEDAPALPEFDSYLPNVATDYLSGRGITENSVAAFEIGWDWEDQRIVIPAKDLNGTTRFLIKRAVLQSQNPKYLYAPEGVSKNSLLFGGCLIDPALIRSQGMIIVEGSLDAIRLYQHGLRNVVATLGTGVSEIQSRIVSRLRPRKIILFFDRDSAGSHGIEIAARRLRRYPIFIVRYPADLYDPAEFSREEANRALKKAIPLARYTARVRQLTR